MIYSNLHSHSTFSDGKNSAEEMLLSAIERGLCSFGLSDHSYTPHDESYCMKKNALSEYLAVCRELKEKYAERIEFFCGLEKDAFSVVEPNNFDYLIGSVHYIEKNGVIFEIDSSREDQLLAIESAFSGDRDAYAARYFETIADHARTGKFDIQGHFDLVTKYGLFDTPSKAYDEAAFAALDTVLDFVPFMEVNTGQIARKKRDVPMPSEEILRRIREKGGELILSADAHECGTISFWFDEAVALLKSIGFKRVWQLRKGGFTPVSLL